MPSLRQETAPVTAMGGRGTLDTSIWWASVLMNSDKICASVNCGLPKSITWRNTQYILTMDQSDAGSA
eukprot:395887-Prorocentrum_minimum.AAC.1